ncbi:exodeoxyribonuclease V subunit gamma [Psychrobacter sp. FDAARGOS_221]|uniref:exodeoxyribonuclease V subunit gamma n=1 Tax=Psychrobacter sp. FDAARGOS_221 TaxID=1975705 RepID=UPI000BB53E34|nr:exodeoxyribonuclease V subunit gamma [Psychrobacter sp. FDAARGOS_221]PNK59655.1 exodeoxyribonuclease V subunit gamma [Psychrobacter sp. FDAARGOS_221]
MFKIIQSNRTEKLVTQLLHEYQSKDQPIFEPFIVIVPSKVLGDWLDKTIASQAGISTLVQTKFWGEYQWRLMQAVLSRHNDFVKSQDPNATTINVPEVAVLSPTVMQWRIFGYLNHYQAQIIKDDKHPLYPLLISLMESLQDQNQAKNSTQNQNQSQTDGQQQNTQDPGQRDARLWQLASDLARVFNRYLTHREDWLQTWSNNKQLPVEQLILEKDSLSLRFDKYARGTPDWLIDHYIELEAAQRHLWLNLFADVHLHRVALEAKFWEVLTNNIAHEQDTLPKVLRIFTIQQLPQAELDFLQRLSEFMDITLLHYNPSKLFWADIVDKSWLERQRIINPESVFLRDYGHSLLSRLGKQSRDTFAMLATLSGGEDYERAQVVWHDDFWQDDYWQDGFFEEEAQPNLESQSDASDSAQKLDNSPNNFSNNAPNNSLNNTPSLLQQLQQDVLMLDEQSTQQATAVRVTKDIGEQLESAGNQSSNPQSTEAESLPKSANIDIAQTDEFDPYSDEVLENKHYDKPRSWPISSQDNSLSIHSCHSLQRQLEVLRIMIGRWLNEPLPEGAKPRHVSDIVVLLPDVERHHALISSIFVNGKGQDGLYLPAKITGVVDADIRQLWEAVIGFYKLLGSDSARFEAAEVFDWLMLPPLYQSFGLTHEQMSRGCDLLVEAGFIRGFDEEHLKQTLDDKDFDYRFSFAQALDRLTLGLVMPEAGMSNCLYPIDEHDWPQTAIAEMSLPLSQVSLNDAPIIEALCRIYSGLVERRYDHLQTMKAEDWLNQIETEVIHRYFADVDQTRSMRAIYNAMNGFKSSLRANRHYQHYSDPSQATEQQKENSFDNIEQLPLKLSFMLDSIEAELESQQVSAEPTGVITFGRFGALRNVPFELVVMLNMNLSEFPGRDRDNRYDLMKATMSRRGDRDSEDDDNGAFLDALLCARSACWIFYNGQSLTDTHEHLPANPVSELLQFLQGEVQWQVSSMQNMPDDIDPDAQSVRRQLPNLIKQWLVTEHPALPFDKSLFETTEELDQVSADDTDESVNDTELTSTDLGSDANDSGNLDLEAQLNHAMRQTKLAQQRQFPPAPLWQSVFNTLKVRDNQPSVSRVELPTPEQYKSIARLFVEPPEQAKPESSQQPKQVNLLGKLGSLDIETIKSLLQLLDHQAAISSNDQSGSTDSLDLDADLACSALADSLFNIEEIDIDGALAYQVRHPGKEFLRYQQVHVVQGQQVMANQEPLFLDPLARYQINEYLINSLANQSQSNDSLEDTSLIDNSSDDNSQSNAQQGVAQQDNQLMYQKIMPAGIARQTTLPNQQQKLQKQCEEFIEQLLVNEADNEPLIELLQEQQQPAHFLLTATKEEPVQLNVQQLFESYQHQASGNNLQDNSSQSEIKQWLSLLPKYIKLKGKVPVHSNTVSTQTTDTNTADALTTTNHGDDAIDVNHSDQLAYSQRSPRYWLNILPSSAGPKHLLKFWLSHLYWQVARGTTAQQVALADGVSYWRFSKSRSDVDAYKSVVAFKLNPVEHNQAAIELIKWALFAKLAGQVPMTLLPEYGLNYVAKVQQSAEEDSQYWTKRSDFSKWFAPGYQQDVYDNCVRHAIWQYVLRDDDAFNALRDGLDNLALPLYQPMYNALTPLKA